MGLGQGKGVELGMGLGQGKGVELGMGLGLWVVHRTIPGKFMAILDHPELF